MTSHAAALRTGPSIRRAHCLHLMRLVALGDPCDPRKQEGIFAPILAMKKTAPLVLAGVAAFTLASPLFGQILEYRFNETGFTAPSSGSDVTPLQLQNASNVPTDLHGAPGTGVSGLVGDRALDFTSANGMGNAATTGPVAFQSADNGNIDGLLSFTLAGWFKTDGTAPINGAARLLGNQSGGNGFLFLAASAGNIQLQVGVGGTTTPFVTTGAAYAATQSWVFFAATFNGALTTNNVNFYVGSSAGQVSLVNTFSFALGGLTEDSAALIVANESTSFQRPFDGYLDNFRVFGSKTDGSGSLSTAALESYRVADLTNSVVPEPGTVALFALGSLLVLGLRRRSMRG